MPVREVRRYAELVRAGDGNEDERLPLLRTHRERVRAQLDTITAYLAAIDLKISYYAGATEDALMSAATGSSPPVSHASSTWLASWRRCSATLGPSSSIQPRPR
jgi:hypothetical protein